MRTAFLSTCLAALVSFGQTFEVASVKPAPPPDPGGRVFMGPLRGGPGTQDPGQITWSNIGLANVLMAAYDVRLYQVRNLDRLGTGLFDIIAKVPAGATKEQVNVMWQNLLKERFGLVIHREPKEFSGEELTVAKGGPKLKPTEMDANAPQFEIQPGPPKLDQNGFPQMNAPGMVALLGPTPNGGGLIAHLVARAQTMEQLASFLSTQHPVVDKTGLTGKYDFTLEFTPDLPPLPPPPGAGPPAPSAGPADPGSNAASAIQQLGLKLSPSKVTVDLLVIDHVEKTPTEN